MSFLYPPLLWGLALVALPALIHLINLLRHRTVRWGAMEFLLKSHKRQRHWLWLKQLLLLLSRMAAVALAALVAAQWVAPKHLSIFAGGAATRHIILIDDSLSTSERAGGTSAFDAAQNLTNDLLRRASDLPGEQRATVARLSHLRFVADDADASETTEPAGNLADIVDDVLDVATLEKLNRLRGSWKPTELSLAPVSGLRWLAQSLEPDPRETRIVYLLSDFRQRDWRDSAEAVELSQKLKQAGGEIQFVQCGRTVEPNVSIVDLVPDGGARAAGVPIFVNVTLRNQGTAAATRVQCKARTWQSPVPGTGEDPAPTIEELPTIVIDSLAPGESVTRRLQTFFQVPGKHVVEVTLGDDAVAADNRRWCVLDCPAGQRVLVVDGSDNQIHAYHLAAAFKPLERSNTGIVAEIRRPEGVQDITANDLRTFTAVYMLDVPRYESPLIKALTEYVTNGGGVLFAFGPNTQPSHVNSALYLDGNGLLPAPIDSPAALPAGTETDGPDLVAEDHPVFSFFRGDRNSFLTGVLFEKYTPLRRDWNPSPEQPLVVAASLRGGYPLMLEKTIGEGRTLTLLSTVGPVWNDWAKNPSFVVVALKTQSLLANRPSPTSSLLTGGAITVEWTDTRHLPESLIKTPDMQGKPSIELKVNAKRESKTAPLALVPAFDPATGESVTDRAGIYEADLLTKEGSPDVMRYAVNVPADEGETIRMPLEDLQQKFEGLAQVRAADEIEPALSDQSGQNFSTIVLALLAAMLALEQILAFWTSGHAVRGGVVTA
jgi:hypothetical protein